MPRASASRGHPGCIEIGGRKPERRQRRQGGSVCRCERTRYIPHRMRRHMSGMQAREPSSLVGRKYAERARVLREHFIELEDHLILAAHPFDSELEQAAL